ncbi:MAG: CvpA family protein, partial [Polymorphobacter sp.]
MIASLTPFDIAVILLISLGGIAGLMRGFVTEVLSLLAWVAGIVAVRFLYAPSRDFLRAYVENDAGAALLAFTLVFVTAFIGFRFVAQMLGTRTRASIVGPLDRLLGLGFGAFKGLIGAAILFLLLTFGLDMLDKGGPRPAWLQAGRTEPLLEMTSKAMVDFVDKTRAGQPIGKSLSEAVTLPKYQAPGAEKSAAKPAGAPAEK